MIPNEQKQPKNQQSTPRGATNPPAQEEKPKINTNANATEGFNRRLLTVFEAIKMPVGDWLKLPEQERLSVFKALRNKPMRSRQILWVRCFMSGATYRVAAERIAEMFIERFYPEASEAESKTLCDCIVRDEECLVAWAKTLDWTDVRAIAFETLVNVRRDPEKDWKECPMDVMYG